MGGYGHSSKVLLFRIVSGVLALAALALVIARLYGYAQVDVALGPESFMNSLRILFPLSVALIFGYIAWKGKFPFMDDRGNGGGQ